MHTDALKARIGETVEALAPTLAAVSREIHANPELGFQEFKAVATLCEALERHGVRVRDTRTDSTRALSPKSAAPAPASP